MSARPSRRELLAGLLGLAACRTGLGPRGLEASAGPAGAPRPATLKLLTWNIDMMPRWLHTSPDNEARAAAIAAELLARDFDILCLQKSFDGGARAVLEAKLGAAYPFRFGPANADCPLLINSGVWVLSRLPLTGYAEIQYQDCSGVECFSRKGAIRLTGSCGGRPFHLVTTHLQGEETPRFTLKNEHVRNRQTLQLWEQLVAPAIEPGVPIIVCGDFGIPRLEDDGKTETFAYHRMLSTLGASNGADVRITLDDRRAANDLASDDTGRRNELDYVLVRAQGTPLEVERERLILRHPGWDSSSRNRRDLAYRYAVGATVRLG